MDIALLATLYFGTCDHYMLLAIQNGLKFDLRNDDEARLPEAGCQRGRPLIKLDWDKDGFGFHTAEFTIHSEEIVAEGARNLSAKPA